MIEKCLSGFGRFASVAAHYRMCDVIDNLVVSLSKFSGLQNVTEPPLTFVPHFGNRLFPDLVLVFLLKQMLVMMDVFNGKVCSFNAFSVLAVFC